MGNLMGKALSGFLILLVSLSVLVFLPAGTMNYFQAWIYLFTFAVSTILITTYLFKYDQKLLERRVKAGPIAEKEKNQKIIQVLANVSFCSVYIIAGFDHRYNWSNIPINASLMADACVALEFYIVFLVFKENSYTSATIEIAKNQKVISTGPYGLVRHPMYSGASLMLVASAIALGSYWSVLCVVLLIFIIIMRLLEEEKFLSKNLSGYNRYCQKVRYHLIPLLW